MIREDLRLQQPPHPNVVQYFPLPDGVDPQQYAILTSGGQYPCYVYMYM